MKNILRTFPILVYCLIFSSCQKVVSLNLSTAPPQLVIEGEITDGPGPYKIMISQSVAFYADNTYPAVSGAVVKISDDLGNTDSLKETSPGVYSTSVLQGKPGATYSLAVTTQNKNYTAVSSMPFPVLLDSVTINVTSGFGQQRMDAMVNFQDPAGITNYYQFVEYINGQPFPQNNFVLDDRLSDGKYISLVLRTDSSYISSGDDVRVDMYSIDENTYTYFLELRQSSATGAFNATASPANPTTNIQGGALGYFSAHTTQSKSVVAN
jgi:hypothetical protein